MGDTLFKWICNFFEAFGCILFSYVKQTGPMFVCFGNLLQLNVCKNFYERAQDLSNKEKNEK